MYTITEIAKKIGINRHNLQLASKRVFGDRIKAHTVSYFEEHEIPLILAELKPKIDHYQRIKSIESDTAIIEIDGYNILIDKTDIDKVMAIDWFITKRPKIKDIYVAHYDHIKNGKKNKTKSLFLHRYIANAQKNEMIDHINMNTLDNRKNNLRLCDKSQNACNAGKSAANKSGYKGVSWDKRKGNWRAYIVKNKKQYYLGNFVNIEAAHAAYCKAAKELHGEFARLA
jgi:hypothetical protein